MKLLLLGSGSATPMLSRGQSASLVSIENKSYLFDCGEATQYKMIEYGVKTATLSQIFITHLHGDHYLGLIGLLSTLNCLGRKNDLEVFAPRGLREILTVQFKYQQTDLNYKLIIRELDSSDSVKIFEDKHIEVFTIPLKHRITCHGFKIVEKQKLRNINKGTLPKNISLAHIHLLKSGEDVFASTGKLLYKNSEHTYEPNPPKKIAYCTDTIFDESIIPLLSGVDILYHESTFLEEHTLKAANTYHSTAKQAATIAKKANVKKLVLAHYSSRYKDISPFESEAKTIFEDTILGVDGLELEA